MCHHSYWLPLPGDEAFGRPVVRTTLPMAWPADVPLICRDTWEYLHILRNDKAQAQQTVEVCQPPSACRSVPAGAPDGRGWNRNSKNKVFTDMEALKRLTISFKTCWLGHRRILSIPPLLSARSLPKEPYKRYGMARKGSSQLILDTISESTESVVLCLL